LLEKYTAVDVETPNRNNDSLCSIGVVRMEYGTPVYKREFLVDPEAHFDPFNITIHGITPEMVKSAPRFPEVWKEIAGFFDGVVIAHNATFDLAVICKMLSRYELKVPKMSYACTLLKSRRHIPKEQCGSHRLNDLCAGLNIPLEHHHNALDDALGCALIMEHLIDSFGFDAKTDLHIYDYDAGLPHIDDEGREKSLRALWEIARECGCEKLSARHHEALEDWARKNDKYLKDDCIRSWLLRVEEILEKGALAQSDYNALMEVWR